MKRYSAALLLIGLIPMWTRAAADDGRRPETHASPPPETTRVCPMEVEGAPEGGGMSGNGWDGAGMNAVTIFWHVEGATPDFGTAQRQALINAMQAWANVVQITFVEIPVPNVNVSVDWNFLTGNHCFAEAAECGDPDCAFAGPGGTLAHAGFPPGVNSACVNPMAETFAGNVHFDEDETWEQDGEGPAEAFSLTYVACHELGHAIGLTHDADPSSIMFASVNEATTFGGLGASDIANIQAGYAAGTGAVITLNTTGVWVNGGYAGVERGTQAQPFNTVAEGAGGVPPASTGVVVYIQTGAYAENLIIDRSMELRPVNGAVVIGN